MPRTQCEKKGLFFIGPRDDIQMTVIKSFTLLSSEKKYLNQHKMQLTRLISTWFNYMIETSYIVSFSKIHFFCEH
jgi:hypothetical protein